MMHEKVDSPGFWPTRPASSKVAYGLLAALLLFNLVRMWVRGILGHSDTLIVSMWLQGTLTLLEGTYEYLYVTSVMTFLPAVEVFLSDMLAVDLVTLEFAISLLSVLAGLYGLFQITKAITSSVWAGLFAVVLAPATVVTFSYFAYPFHLLWAPAYTGGWIMNFSVLAFGAWFGQQDSSRFWWLPIVAAGVLFNFHPTTGAIIGGIIGLSELVRAVGIKEDRARYIGRVAVTACLFLLMALPLLIKVGEQFWNVRAVAGNEDLWWDMMLMRKSHHLFPLYSFHQMVSLIFVTGSVLFLMRNMWNLFSSNLRRKMAVTVSFCFALAVLQIIAGEFRWATVVSLVSGRATYLIMCLLLALLTAFIVLGIGNIKKYCFTSAIKAEVLLVSLLGLSCAIFYRVLENNYTVLATIAMFLVWIAYLPKVSSEQGLKRGLWVVLVLALIGFCVTSWMGATVESVGLGHQIIYFAYLLSSVVILGATYYFRAQIIKLISSEQLAAQAGAIFVAPALLTYLAFSAPAVLAMAGLFKGAENVKSEVENTFLINTGSGYEAALSWLREQSPRDSFVLLPPYPAQKVLVHQRPSIIDGSSMGYSVYIRTGLDYELEALDVIFGVQAADLKSIQPEEYHCMMENGYARFLSTLKNIQRAKQVYPELDYIVGFQPGTTPQEWTCLTFQAPLLELPIVFQNDNYVIYSVKNLTE